MTMMPAAEEKGFTPQPSPLPAETPATSVRFEPGEEKEVQLTEMGGRQRVFGLNDLTRAQATDDTKAASMETAKLKGFL